MSRLPTPSMPGAAQLVATVVLIAAVSPFAVFAVPQVVGADEGFVTLVVGPLVLLGASELLAWARREPDGRGEEPVSSPGTDANDPDTSGGSEGPDAIDADTTADWEFPAADADVDAGSTAGPDGTVSVAAVDLKLTLLAMGTLLAYAGWNVHREVSLTAAPTPISVGAFTAGLLGLLFAGWVTLAAWRAARAARSELESGPAPDPEPDVDSDPMSELEPEPEPDPEPKPTPLADVPALTDGSGGSEDDDE